MLVRKASGQWTIGTEFGHVRRCRAENGAGYGLKTLAGFHCKKGDVLMTWGPVRLLTQREADNLPVAWDGYVTDWENNLFVIPDIPVADIAHFGPCLLNSASTEAGEIFNTRMERDVESATIEIVAVREIKSHEPLLLQYGGEFDKDLFHSRAELDAARMERTKSRKGVHPSKFMRCNKCLQWCSRKDILPHYWAHMK
jgi:hypothetical protein